MVESILDQLSNQQWRSMFDVFHLEVFFNKFKNKIETNHGRDAMRINVTNTFIEQDRHDDAPNISCDFQEREDVTRHARYRTYNVGSTFLPITFVKKWASDWSQKTFAHL